jgi:hypothetical protein
MAAQLQGMLRTPLGFVSTKTKFLTVGSLRNGHPQIAVPECGCSAERLAQTTLWTSRTEVKYMGRTAIAWGSASAHNLAAYSQSELEFATNFNMYPEVQLPPTNGSLGHTRGEMNCAMA